MTDYHILCVEFVEIQNVGNISRGERKRTVPVSQEQARFSLSLSCNRAIHAGLVLALRLRADAERVLQKRDRAEHAVEQDAALERGAVAVVRARSLTDLQENIVKIQAVFPEGTELPEDLPEEMLQRRAGVFVSLHKDGRLRGCIGTIQATRRNIAEEIMENAVSASTRDPRFGPVLPEELDTLEIGVDVLGDTEKIQSKDELDVKHYGVIVSKGFRRGLLLPNLDGVDTVEEQIAIALSKAGISPREKNFEMERFEVVRHEA